MKYVVRVSERKIFSDETTSYQEYHFNYGNREDALRKFKQLTKKDFILSKTNYFEISVYYEFNDKEINKAKHQADEIRPDIYYKYALIDFKIIKSSKK